MGLLRPGHEELALTGVVVADSSRRAGLAVAFQGLHGPTRSELRRVVLDQQVKSATADDVEPTRGMRASDEEPEGRDRELDELRRRLSLLTAENEKLRSELEDALNAHLMVGRALEIEKLRARSGDHGIDVELLGAIKRDAELAWTAIARLSDACDKMR
jgi:hypothetical protein